MLFDNPITDLEESQLDEDAEQELSLNEFTKMLMEVREQPPWRTKADKEVDFGRDGNQISSDLLQRMRELGIPPAVMPLIGIYIDQALGAQVKRRANWRVISDTDSGDDQVAKAFGFKLNQAERRSRADRACSDAYESQYCVGVGFVEVTRANNPFDYPYRCNVVHRNELVWDWDGYLKSPMGQDARFIARRKWFHKDLVKCMFPQHSELIDATMSGWGLPDTQMFDGGHSTNLAYAFDQERGWTIEEQEWRNLMNQKLLLHEVWYRRWSNVYILRAPDGRIVEFDMDNPKHIMALNLGVNLERATVSKVRRAWFAGCHKLADEPTPYLHNFFPYVPFWGNREDRTGVPYGRIRSMMYMQENINSCISKIRWGLSSVVVKRTDGAYKGTAEQLRNQIARVDADVVLNREHMAMPGATFEIDRNFQLNAQQFSMFEKSIESLRELSGVNQMSSANQEANSAQQFRDMLAQASQGLANIDDNFDESRTLVGELLLSMCIQDAIGKRETVNIKATALTPGEQIELNEPYHDEETGMQLLNNDVSRIALKVTLDDIPASKSYKQMQLGPFSEAFKASNPQIQTLMMPKMIDLMEIEGKDELIKQLQEVAAKPSPDIELKMKELEMKQTLVDAQIEQLKQMATKIKAESVKIGTEAQYSAIQTAGAIVQTPDIGIVADVVMENAGYQTPVPPGVDPNYMQNIADQSKNLISTPTQPQPNTQPNLPPVIPEPPTPGIGAKKGIETQRLTDNT